MQAMIEEEGGSFELASWDWWYYAEKVRKEKYDLDDEILRPYFELKSVREGLFYVLEQLYGIKMLERTDIPKPHPEAYTYEVREQDGTHIGILYMDFYPRSSKSGGAWMEAYRKQQVKDGVFITPVITNVFNFSKPAGDQPALLTFDEASTMFHEMGHALHGLLSNCTYRSISGTAVAIDFVELPSQIMENWAAEPEVLKMYAKHYKTGEPIPDELIARMVESSKFNQGFSMTERLAASLLDLSWHNTRFRGKVDPVQFEEMEMKKIGLMEEIIPRYKSPYFGHIFAGDMYSAGYYSYLWAEVLDADAFNAFKESGDIFNPEMAGKFREYVLSKGGTQEPMVLYRKFRGSDPDINAFLIRTGLE
jgi:peptidyl-dipeptidase Dcp